MRAWLAYVWYRLTAGLWVVPALMSASAVALAHLMRAGDRSPLIHGQEGTLRLITNPTTFDDAADAAFNQIRQAANGQVSVLIRVIEALTTFAEIATTEPHRAALARHADMIRRACRGGIAEKDVRADAEHRLRALDAVLAEGRDPGIARAASRYRPPALRDRHRAVGRVSGARLKQDDAGPGSGVACAGSGGALFRRPGETAAG